MKLAIVFLFIATASSLTEE